MIPSNTNTSVSGDIHSCVKNSLILMKTKQRKIARISHNYYDFSFVIKPEFLIGYFSLIRTKITNSFFLFYYLGPL